MRNPELKHACADGRCGAADCPRCHPESRWPHPHISVYDMPCPRCHGLREIKVAQVSPPFYHLEYCPVCVPWMRPAGQSQVERRRNIGEGEDGGVKGQT